MDFIQERNTLFLHDEINIENEIRSLFHFYEDFANMLDEVMTKWIPENVIKKEFMMSVNFFLDLANKKIINFKISNDSRSMPYDERMQNQEEANQYNENVVNELEKKFLNSSYNNHEFISLLRKIKNTYSNIELCWFYYGLEGNQTKKYDTGFQGGFESLFSKYLLSLNERLYVENKHKIKIEIGVKSDFNQHLSMVTRYNDYPNNSHYWHSDCCSNIDELASTFIEHKRLVEKKVNSKRALWNK